MVEDWCDLATWHRSLHMNNCYYSDFGLGEGSISLSSASRWVCGVDANLSFVDATRAAELLRLILTPGD